MRQQDRCDEKILRQAIKDDEDDQEANKDEKNKEVGEQEENRGARRRRRSRSIQGAPQAIVFIARAPFCRQSVSPLAIPTHRHCSCSRRHQDPQRPTYETQSPDLSSSQGSASATRSRVPTTS
jgi:hypothetical protein